MPEHPAPQASFQVAILFDNFGPYHLARLAGSSRVMEVLGIEFGGSSHEYAWVRSEVEALRTVTLFPANSSQQVTTAALRKRLDEELDRFRPKAVAIPGWSGRGAFLALEWCLKNQVPAIVMSESTAHDEVRSGWREWIKRRYVGLCTAALVGGKPHREYMEELGMTPECIFLGYDAVDNGYFAAEAVQKTNENHLPENYFLASARFIEKKNLTNLIDAYAQYREQSKIKNQKSKIWDLVLLGDGELRPTLDSQLLSLNLSGHVHLPGFKQYPELPMYYGSAKAFIHASTTEQWGLVVNEAMASGLPVLVSNRCGCAPDLVHEGVNGFTFDPENVDQLAELMLKLCLLASEENQASDVVRLRSTLNCQKCDLVGLGSQLSSMGTASREIISHWGPDRFAQGLKAAVELVLQLGPKPAIFFDRLLLQSLVLR